MRISGITACVGVCLVALAAPAASGTSEGINPNSTLDGDRILVLATDLEAGDTLAGILTELYAMKVSVKPPAGYAPEVDEYAYDGLVYYGGDYHESPKTGLVEDIERTAKPVLWINYHGWRLSEEFLSENDIVISDEHSMTSAAMLPGGRRVAMEATDVTRVDAPESSVLYWLESEAGAEIPGAVESDNFTYVSYLPSLDIFDPSFPLVLKAVRSTFGSGMPPETPTAPGYGARIESAKQDRFRTGIHLPVYVARTTAEVAGYDADQWHDNLLRIKKSGAEWVNIVRTYFQKDLYANEVQADPDRTPTLASLENIIRDAHTLGLLVRLHIAINLVEREPLHWHGMIAPRDREKWWKSYGGHVVEMAEFARRHEVESLVIGTEFTSMEKDAEQWRDLVDRVRNERRYPGLVGYGINYGRLKLTWADALDFLSVSAYWPLSEDRDPDLATLAASWQRLDAQLRELTRKELDVPLEFGEVGYSTQPYATVLPFSWKAHRGRQQDLGEQLNAYQALYGYLKDAEYIAGVHFFASTEEDTQEDSIGYTPFGKPAERVMEQIINLR